MPADENIDGELWLPRSLEESPAYAPDWRFRQGIHYAKLKARAEAANDLSIFPGLPVTETDGLVADLYFYERTGSCDKPTVNAAIRYARDAERENATVGAASRLRAYALAGLSIRQAAERIGTLPLHVATFYGLFFDVARYLSNRDFVSRLVFPFTVPRSETQDRRKERLWLSVAFLLGLKGLETVLYRSLSPSASQLEELHGMIRSVLAHDALNFCLARHAAPLPQMEDYERYATLQMVPRQDDPQAEEKTRRFAGGLAEVLEKNSRGRAPDDPLMLIQSAARQIAGLPAAGAKNAPARASRPPSTRVALRAAVDLSLDVDGAWSAVAAPVFSGTNCDWNF